MTRPSPVTPEAFVRQWTAAPTFAAFLVVSGMESDAARSRASYYRKIGIPLKRFQTGRARVDVAALSRLAKEPT